MSSSKLPLTYEIVTGGVSGALLRRIDPLPRSRNKLLVVRPQGFDEHALKPGLDPPEHVLFGLVVYREGAVVPGQPLEQHQGLISAELDVDPLARPGTSRASSGSGFLFALGAVASGQGKRFHMLHSDFGLTALRAR